ncbi:uncharacterized protein LOC129058233 isoform X1 [Pongo abelii]|uniref:uncharacterized protein LOC129058233 isoform X1 n=1 Tax=Pongo abelii TaxID=9601 RepID=UPI003004D30F
MQPIQYVSSSASRYWATRNSSPTLNLVQEHIFSKNHKQFRIISWKLDELHCQFPVLLPGSLHLLPLLTLHCNIMESYPSSSSMWFVDSDDPNLTLVLECTKNKLTPRTWTPSTGPSRACLWEQVSPWLTPSITLNLPPDGLPQDLLPKLPDRNQFPVIFRKEERYWSQTKESPVTELAETWPEAGARHWDWDSVLAHLLLFSLSAPLFSGMVSEAGHDGAPCIALLHLAFLDTQLGLLNAALVILSLGTFSCHRGWFSLLWAGKRTRELMALVAAFSQRQTNLVDSTMNYYCLWLGGLLDVFYIFSRCLQQC